MAWSTAFSKQEDQFIRKNYPQMGPTEIAKRLGRSRQGVSARITKLGLRQNKSTKRARVIDEKPEQKKGYETLLRVAKRGDEKEMLETMRNILAERIDETESARDTATLMKRMLEVGARLSELNGSSEKKKEKKTAEVTRFEVIASKRAAHRAAAKG